MIPFLRDIQFGTVGPDVLALKRALIRWNKFVNPGLNTSTQEAGYTMGAQAVSLLKRFQGANGLASDGVMGSATYTKLTNQTLFDAYGVSLLEAEQDNLEVIYRNPFRGIVNLGFDGYDQGADWFGSGVVYAIGPGTVHDATTTSGWPGGGAVAYTFTGGPADGKTVYFAENITPQVRVGQAVTASTVIAILHADFPHCETGWAEPGTATPMSQPVSSEPSYFGVNFGAFLRSVGVSQAPVGAGQSGTPLPVGWPTWGV